MIKATCKAKYRDKNGKIVEYLLVDSTGKQQKVNAYQLKMSIKAGLISVSNLKLSSDDRLIENKDSSEKIKRSPNRGSKIHNEIAQAIILLGDCMRGMGDYLVDEVDGAYSLAGMSLEPFDYDLKYDKEISFPHAGEENNYYYNMYIKVIRILLERDPGDFLFSYIDTYEDNEDLLCHSLVQYNAYEPSKHPIVKSLSLITDYTKFLVSQGKIKESYYNKIKNVRDNVSKVDLPACKVGYQIAYSFVGHLDRTYFGTISNDAFTVGGVMTNDDPESKIGAYVCHAELDRYKGYTDNSGYSIAFNTMSNGIVRARIIYYTRRPMENTWAHKDTGVYIDIDRKKQDLRTVAHKLSHTLNKLAAKRKEEMNKQ